MIFEGYRCNFFTTRLARWDSDRGMGNRTVSVLTQPLDDFQVRGRRAKRTFGSTSKINPPTYPES
jgi:hypothetical protein